MRESVPLSLRHVDHLNAIVVTLPAANFSSTNGVGLGLFDSALSEFAGNSAAFNVILDLSAVEIAGSGFLTCLDSFEKKLSTGGRRLTVCGDQTGLIELVGWHSRMRYQQDLVSALNDCATQAA